MNNLRKYQGSVGKKSNISPFLPAFVVQALFNQVQISQDNPASTTLFNSIFKIASWMLLLIWTETFKYLNRKRDSSSGINIPGACLWAEFLLGRFYRGCLFSQPTLLSGAESQHCLQMVQEFLHLSCLWILWSFRMWLWTSPGSGLCWILVKVISTRMQFLKIQETGTKTMSDSTYNQWTGCSAPIHGQKIPMNRK